MIKAKRKVVFCKVEAVYAQDALPVAADDALLVHNFTCKPLDIKWVDRNPSLPFFGNQGKVRAGDFMRMEYDIEIAGAGGVATVPKYSPALLGSVLSETVTAVTGPVTYAQIGEGEDSCTKYFYWDGLLHKMLGAKAVVSLKMDAGGVPMLHFAWMGLYGGITDVALPTPVLAGFQKPLAVNKANTTFTLHGYAGVLRSLSINSGTQLQYVNVPNQEAIRFVDRKSTGSVAIELPLIAGKDFFTSIRAETTGALAVVHGTAAGNKALIDAATVQLTDPSYSETEGVAVITMGMELLPTSAGNDEWTYKTQ